MKMYHYSKKGNTVLSEGLFSFVKSPYANLRDYYYRLGGEKTREEIEAWMESCFKGRSRGIRFFTEPIKWCDKNKQCLGSFAEKCDCFELDLEALATDGVLENVYCSPAAEVDNLEAGRRNDEEYVKLSSYKDIDFSPINWEVCDDEAGRRFAFVRYYLLIVKDGVIEPKYLRLIDE